MSMTSDQAHEITPGAPVRVDEDGGDWLASVLTTRKVRGGLWAADVMAINDGGGHRPGEMVTGIPLRRLTAVTSRQLYVQAQAAAVMLAARAHDNWLLEAVTAHMQREDLEMSLVDVKAAPRLAAVPDPRARGGHEAAAERILENERVAPGTRVIAHGLLAVAEGLGSLREQMTSDLDAAVWTLAGRIAGPGGCLADQLEEVAAPLCKTTLWDRWLLLWDRAGTWALRRVTRR